MATKLQLITGMYEYSVGHVTDDSIEWQRFLHSASRNYKLSFEEQILVHAQRPDATAVLELNKWNTQFGRWVNRGATGIAVIDRDFPGKRRLKYYFDVSDTHGSRRSRPVPIWEMKPEYEADVIETLEASFGELSEKETLAQAIISAAGNAVTDNVTDYLNDLYDCCEGSFLEVLAEPDLERIYTDALKNSIAFMWLARCGIEPTTFFEPEDFQAISGFNTPDTATVLGAATSAIAEMGLREIASAVLNLQKNEKNINRTFANEQNISDNNDVIQNERSFDNGSLDLQRSERVSDTRPDPAGGTGGTPWKIRVNAPEVPDGKPQGAVQPVADERRSEPAPDRNRTDGDGTVGTPVSADGGAGGRNRADEILRPAGVDTENDEHQEQGGGNDTERPDLRLDLPTPEEQLNRIEEAEGLNDKPSAISMSVPQEAIDEELCWGSGVFQGKFRIYQHFQELHTEDENIKFLKNEFGTGSHSPRNENGFGVSMGGKGLTFTKGDSLNPDIKYTLPWKKVAKRISELIAADRYLNIKDKEEFYPQYLEYQENQKIIRQKEAALDAALDLPLAERRETLVPRIVDFLNGLNEHSGYLNKQLTINGFEEIADTVSAEQIEAILSDPQQSERLAAAMKAIGGASSGIFERNHGYRFHEELASLYPRRPVYHLGDTVYIGSHEYEVLSFDDSTISLYDTKFPMINKDMPRDEFDRKVAENPANGHLMKMVFEQAAPEEIPLQDSEPEKTYLTAKSEYPDSIVLVQVGDFIEAWDDDAHIVSEIFDFYVLQRDGYNFCGFPLNNLAENVKTLSENGHSTVLVSEDGKGSYRYFLLAEIQQNKQEEPPLLPIVGDRYEIEGRLFVVDSVDVEYDKVSLRDVIFQNNVGFPIFRSETIEFVQMYDPIREETAEPEPQEPIPVGRLDFLDDDGTVAESLEFTDEQAFIDRIFHEDNYGAAFTIVVYRGGEGGGNLVNTNQFIEEINPSTGLRFEDVPERTEPSLADNQHIERIGGVEYIVTTPFSNEQKPRKVESGVNFPGEIVIVKDHIPQPEEVESTKEQSLRFVVKKFAKFDVIRSNPRYISFADNVDRYGVWDNDKYGFLMKDTETTLVFYSESEAQEYADKVNRDGVPITPAWEQKKKPVRVNYFDAFPDVPMSERHNFKITDDKLGHGGAKAKFRANMDAICLLHELELDGKLATPEQQEILSRYVGWGSLSQAFKENNPGWENEFIELYTTLSPEEYESARATTLNAHYTSPTVIKAIYKAVENMGFRTGNILDPGCGVGNFQGLLPDSMAESKMYGVEIDPITGRICQQLYQKNSIAIQGYEKTPLPDSFFDLAVGNVPFGSYGVSDKKYDKYKFHIHDYFFAKTLDKVRPGGVVAFITSSWTMDKQNPAVRKYIAQRAELLGAIRLPNNAFLANAGTQVTTDILFLQKRDRVVDVEPEWLGLEQIEDAGNPEEAIPVNAYFAEHPKMILGTMGREDGTRMYGSMNSTTCMPFPDRELSDLLDEAIQNIHAEISVYERDEDEHEADDSIPADPSVRNFSYAVVEGKVYFREDSRMKPCELSATAESRIKGMIAIRDCVRTLIEYQTEDYPESDITAEQAKLNRLYDNFTKKYGLISSRANVSVFGSDSSYPLLGALEELDEDGNLLRKADMFTKRTIRPKVEITHVDTPSEALAVSLGEMARVDLEYMSELTGMDRDALIMTIQERLYEKVNKEFVSFLDELKQMPAEDVIDRAYEKVIKEDILCVLESRDMPDREAKALIKLKEPLDGLYREWLHNDYSHMDLIRDTIGDLAKREIRYQRDER